MAAAVDSGTQLLQDGLMTNTSTVFATLVNWQITMLLRFDYCHG
jgi:hypothetical protein